MNSFKRYALKFIATGVCWVSGISLALATTITYDFDAFTDGASLTSQYSGISFTNATVLKAGYSLNEFSFPPHSGDGAVFDDGGPMHISFNTLAHSVSGYFTYLDGLTLWAYDRNDNLLATATSAYLTNLADGTGDPGSMPNELLSVSSPGDQIARVVIGAANGGSSLVLDDLTTITSTTALPVPGTFALVLTGLALAWRRRTRPRRR